MAALGINLNALIAQFLVFAIVLFVLWRYVYPALLKTLDQRRDAIRVGMENAEKSRQELADAEKRVAAMLDEARQEAQRTLANATVAAQHVRDGARQGFLTRINICETAPVFHARLAGSDAPDRRDAFRCDRPTT